MIDTVHTFVVELIWSDSDLKFGARERFLLEIEQDFEGSRFEE